MLALPVLLAVCDWRRPFVPFLIAGWLALCVLSLSFYLYGYRTPEWYPSPTESLRHPAHALIFLAAFLGAPLAPGSGTSQLAAATLIGTFSAILFVGACTYLWVGFADRSLRKRMIVFVMIGVYSLGTGLMVMPARLWFGIPQALSSRYPTFSLYLPVALLYLAPIVLEHARANGYLLSRVRITRFASAVVAVLLLLHALTAMHGVLRARAFRAHEEIGSDEQPESLLGAGDRDPTDPIDIEGDEAGEQEAHQHLVAHVPAGDCAEGEEEQVRKELPKLVVLREEVGKREGALSQVHEQPSGCPLVGVRHIDAVRRDQEGGEADGKHGEADKERPDRCRHGIGGGCHGGGTETSGSCAPAVSA